MMIPDPVVHCFGFKKQQAIVYTVKEEKLPYLGCIEHTSTFYMYSLHIVSELAQYRV